MKALRSALGAASLAVALAAGAGPANAQGIAGMLRQAQAHNQVATVQEGANNAAAVVQNGQGNSAGVMQFGNGNTGLVNQSGDRNTACLVQVGRGLDGSIVQSGNDMSTGVLQTRRGTREISPDICQGRGSLLPGLRRRR